MAELSLHSVLINACLFSTLNNLVCFVHVVLLHCVCSQVSLSIIFCFALADIVLHRQIPGVPVIYGLRNSLFLDQPSTHQREFVKSIEDKRLHMSDSEYQKLQKINLKDKLENSTDLPRSGDDSGSEYVTASGTNRARRKLDVTDKSKFKRKRAKVRTLDN